MLEIDPSGWKGSVPYGLGADISLPPCLATGIWNLVPKATSGPKSRGASLGTKLWRHVQRYCAQFLAFMVIYGNSVLWAFCHERLGMHSLAPHFFVIMPWVFQLSCCVSSLMSSSNRTEEKGVSRETDARFCLRQIAWNTCLLYLCQLTRWRTDRNLAVQRFQTSTNLNCQLEITGET